MINMKKASTRTVVAGGIIAAMYTVLTYISAAFSLAYGPIQFRISELLTVLPIFTPVAVSGLTIGCFLANIGSANAVDLVFGTAATLIAALLTRALRGITVKGVPVLSFIAPILVNAFTVGFEITAFFVEKFTLGAFLLNSFQVGLGQTLVIAVLGVPFYMFLRRNKKLIPPQDK